MCFPVLSPWWGSETKILVLSCIDNRRKLSTVKRFRLLGLRFVLFFRLDRIKDEIAELGDVAVSMETNVANRQEVLK